MEDCGVVVVDFISLKEEERQFPPGVSHITVNHYYLCHPYYHDGWCVDLIQLVLHPLHLQRNLNHCFVGVV